MIATATAKQPTLEQKIAEINTTARMKMIRELKRLAGDFEAVAMKHRDTPAGEVASLAASAFLSMRAVESSARQGIVELTVVPAKEAKNGQRALRHAKQKLLAKKSKPKAKKQTAAKFFAAKAKIAKARKNAASKPVKAKAKK